MADRVVEKVAGRAAAEVDRAAAVPRHLLGKTVGRLHPQSRPHTSARVDGSTASVSVAISVRYPEPARAVAAEVRSGVIARVGELCGLDVVEVHVDVAHFHTPEQAQPTRRVR